MPNIHEPDLALARPGSGVRRAQIGAALGTARLGVSLWEIPPGEPAYPYHFHFGGEEVLVVLDGAPVLRTPGHETTLGPGDVVAFPVGDAGAHQLLNGTERAVRFLALSTLPDAEVVVYPELGSVALADMRRRGSGFRRFTPMDDVPAAPDTGTPPTRANLDTPHFDEPRDHPGFVARRARVGYQLGTERLGVSLWEVPVGQAAYPYHFHFGEEELLIVLAGRPALRTPDGWSRPDTGDIVAFAIGEQGAHQVVNDTDDVVRFLAVSFVPTADVVVYPDERKVCAADRRGTGEGLKLYFDMDAAVDYHAGVAPPEVPDVDPA